MILNAPTGMIVFESLSIPKFLDVATSYVRPRVHQGLSVEDSARSQADYERRPPPYCDITVTPLVSTYLWKGCLDYSRQASQVNSDHELPTEKKSHQETLRVTTKAEY